MKIVRHVSPNGAPIIVQSQLDDNGEVIKETVRLFPIIYRDGSHYVGEELSSLTVSPLKEIKRNQHPPTI